MARWGARYAELLAARDDEVSLADGLEALLEAVDARFEVVSSAPVPEIRRTLQRLGVLEAFATVHGAPEEKVDALRGLPRTSRVFLGDAPADAAAADLASVPFIGVGPVWADDPGRVSVGRLDDARLPGLVVAATGA